MTTYTSVPDSDLDPESPGTTTMFTRLRDNPIAITEGATGAPRIVGAAAKYRDDYDVITGVTATATYDTSSFVQDKVIGTQTTNSTSYVLAYTYTNVLLSGTVNYKTSHYTQTGGFLSYLQVRKNGVAVATWSTSSTTGVERSIDIAVVPGDVITWHHYTANVSDASYSLSSASYASETYIERPLYVKASESTVS